MKLTTNMFLCHSECDANCINCDINGATKCDPSSCKPNFRYVSSSQTCEGMQTVLYDCLICAIPFLLIWIIQIPPENISPCILQLGVLQRNVDK